MKKGNQKTQRKIARLVLHLSHAILAAGLVMLVVLISQSDYENFGQFAASVYVEGQDFIKSFTYEFDAQKEIAQLPQEVQDELRENNWQIIQTSQITDETTASLSQAGDHNIVGLTVPDQHVIYLSKDDLTAHYTFFHEAGHVLDGIHDWVSRSGEFNAIYQEEKDSYADANYHQASGYATSSAQEYFASVFCDIMLNNQKNLESVPQTVEFIKALYEGETL